MEITLPIQENYSLQSEHGLGSHDLVLDLGSGEPIPALSILDARRVRTVAIRFEPSERNILSIAVVAVPVSRNATRTEAFELGSIVIRPATVDALQLQFTLALADNVLFANIEGDGAFTAELSRPAVRALEQLEAMVGLAEAKRQVRAHLSFIELQQRRSQMDLTPVKVSRHLIFVGSPGTGKTTVARLIGEVYRGYGICRTSAFVEVSRSDLVAGYIGQTALKTTEKLAAARGGVLFIDEAYALAPENSDRDFGREAIDTIVKFMDDHRDDIIVIVAGYKDEMKRFVEANPGLASRFKTTIEFEGYSPSEMMEIFHNFCNASSYRLASCGDVPALVQSHFASISAAPRKNFAYGREVRNFFETCIEVQAERVSSLIHPTREQIGTIEYVDVVKAAFPNRVVARRA